MNYWIQHGLVLLGGEKMSKSTKLFFLIEDVCQVRRIRTRSATTCCPRTSAVRSSSARSVWQEAGIALSRLQATAAALREAAGPPPDAPADPFPPGLDPEPGVPRGDGGVPRGAEGRLQLRARDRPPLRPARGSEPPPGRCRPRARRRTTVREGQMVFHHLAGPAGTQPAARRGRRRFRRRCRRWSDERAEARQSKDWAKADLLRQEILAQGFLVEDKGGKSDVRSCR